MTSHSPLPTAADFMQAHVHTLAPEVSLDEAVRFLLKHRISNAPVVAEDGGQKVLLGFLSERDCLEHLANDAFYEQAQQPITVRMMMKLHPICVPPQADLFALATVFYQQGFRHLPVVEDTRLLGIVSRRDVMRAMHDYWKTVRSESKAEHFPPDLHEIANLRFIMR